MSTSTPLLYKPAGLKEALQLATPDELIFIADLLLADEIFRILPNSESKKRLLRARKTKNLQNSIDDLALEIRALGSDNVASFFRGGEPVEYEEVVKDVADYLKIKPTKNVDIADIEQLILEKQKDSLVGKLKESKIPDHKLSGSEGFSFSVYRGSSILFRAIDPMRDVKQMRQDLDALGLIVACVASIRNEVITAEFNGFIEELRNLL